MPAHRDLRLRPLILVLFVTQSSPTIFFFIVRCSPLAATNSQVRGAGLRGGRRFSHAPLTLLHGGQATHKFWYAGRRLVRLKCANIGPAQRQQQPHLGKQRRDSCGHSAENGKASHDDGRVHDNDKQRGRRRFR